MDARYHINILDPWKFELQQKYLADQSDSSESDESEDDVSDSGNEDEYSIPMAYDLELVMCQFFQGYKYP